MLASLATDAAPTPGGRSMGHVALHYGRREDAARAARLFSVLGYVETQALPLPDGSTFYRFVVHSRHQGRGDGIVYLSQLPDALADVVTATREALGVGTEHEHASVAKLRTAVDNDPEYMFHLGLLVDSLEELEQLTLELKALNCDDPDFKGRLKVLVNRPRRGDADIDARLDASPAFRDVDRYAYGRNGVQLFVETDLLASGPLAESLVLELDYIFPGKTSHILSVVEL